MDYRNELLEALDFVKELILCNDVSKETKEQALYFMLKNAPKVKKMKDFNLTYKTLHEIVVHLENERKIKAIKLFREVTGKELLESKNLIDEYIEDLRKEGILTTQFSQNN